jgi:OOP family OmpA-OmpF porin
MDAGAPSAAPPPVTETPPVADRDGDGVPDSEDYCPDRPGPRDVPAFAGKPGCPYPECPDLCAGKLHCAILHEVVAFSPRGSATLSPIGHREIENARAAIEAQPDVRRIRVRGHAPDVAASQRGRRARVATERAGRVRDWLVEHGVARERLEIDVAHRDESARGGDDDGWVDFEVTDPDQTGCCLEPCI